MVCRPPSACRELQFDPLLDYDDSTNLVPRLAESMPEISEDATTYTFKLRQGVKFHNGREVKADDVVYTLTRVLDPATASPGAGFYVGIQGAQEFMDGSADTVAGIEAPMTVTLRFNGVKNANLPELAFVTPPNKKLTVADTGGYYVRTAHGPDLYANAQKAIRYIHDYLEAERGLTRAQAYCLCGVAVDLKISEIVDAPNWIVSAYLPLGIFK